MNPQRKIVTASPENSETPLDNSAGWVTPNRLFFVRNHFEPPVAADAAAWTCTLDGLVARPTAWTFAELAAMPQHTVFATVECAGNGRSFLRERAEGVQWGAGAIGNAEWSGVPLRTLLEPAGLAAGAMEVVFEGADHGEEHGHAMNFSRSLPLAKALHPDTIIALRMNGEWLEPNHGAPMRLFVPGHYGVASVKWLRAMRVIDHAYPGFFQTTKYSVNRPGPGGKVRQPIGASAVKSAILQPPEGAQLGLGRHLVAGLAWAGEEKIAGVDVSSDGGRTWQAAQLKGIRQPYCWCQWETRWTVGAAGDYTLLARAHTETGQTQPLDYNPDNLGYIINLPIARHVSVAASRPAQVYFADAPPWNDFMEAYATENSRRPLDVELALTAGDGI
jgi:DMSO/TMAO reductase YedYZ molybdopterin-dependent catalytic subunit